MKLRILIIALLMTGFAQAQDLSISGGISASNINSQADSDGKLGFSVGVSGEWALSPSLSLVASPGYAQMGADVNGVAVSLAELCLPIQLKYELPLFYLLAGVQGGINVQANADDGTQSLDIGDDTKNTDFGPAFGLGFDLGSLLGLPLFVQGDYFHGIVNVNKLSGDDLQNRVFRVSGGLRL